MNIQPIEKRDPEHTGETLEVHSVFNTIQGEGPFTGRHAIFIRLAGCNLQCPACDTAYTSPRESLTVEKLVAKVHETYQNNYQDSILVVITGGEPFRQNITFLARKLLNRGYTVQIETNGTLPPSEGLRELCSIDTRTKGRCFVVCSPKTGKINKELLPLVCAYKYVMSGDSVGSDGLPVTVLGHSVGQWVARPPEGFKGPVYLQPADNGNPVDNKRNLQACVDSVMRNGYTLQLQIHKLIGVE